MYFTPSPLNPTDAMPELARRVGLILADLAGLVAARFLRRPHVAGLIVLLWHRLQRVAPRLARAMARPPVQRARRAAVRRDQAERPPAARLPGRRGWRLRELGYEAAAYRSQVEALLREPAMQAALAAVPQAGRLLRPVFRMLDLPDLTVTPAVSVAVGLVRPPDRPGAVRDGLAEDQVVAGVGGGKNPGGGV